MTPELIYAAVCLELDIDLDDLCGRGRTRELSDARWIGVQICKELLPHLNDKQVGCYINRHRSTVIHGWQTFSALYNNDPAFKLKYERVIGSLNKLNPCHPLNNQTPRSETSNDLLQPTSDGLKCTAPAQTKNVVQSERRNLTRRERNTVLH